MASKVSKTKFRLPAARYSAIVAGCFLLGLVVGFNPLAYRIDDSAYDVMTNQAAPPKGETSSVVVALDEKTFETQGGVRNTRQILAEALDRIAEAQPASVAIDIILHDAVDPVLDARLEASLRATRNLVLPCDEVGGQWEDPLPRFKPLAAALGHVVPEAVRRDGISRELQLEQIVGGERRWSLSLEAYRATKNLRILESPSDLQVGTMVIPAARRTGSENGARPLWIRYLPAGIPTISVTELTQNLPQLRGKTVFVGITALTAARDRLVNPYQQNIAGVEVHAQAFETLMRGEFLSPASDATVMLVCLGFAVALGVVFSLLSGWTAYGVALAIVVAAHYIPSLFFGRNILFPTVAPAAVAWISASGAATFQAFFVRRQLARAESERSRYQKAIHWVTHEMRTPLTAIQGSSEIMAHYNLPAEKQHQLSEMINSESKRLSRIIQTFLDVERLAEGEVELKREPFELANVVESCLKRVGPIAERKRIEVTLDNPVNAVVLGDPELIEYCLYNLLTNAVKYSPQETHVRVYSEQRNGELRLSVEDQGMGMDAKELKSIFQKFYRTKRAEASGEVGTGIGLSIVDEIVKHHQGRMEVTSEPGKGSCFTMVLRTHQNSLAMS